MLVKVIEIVRDITEYMRETHKKYKGRSQNLQIFSFTSHSRRDCLIFRNNQFNV